MKQADHTREQIIALTAPVFNKKGYFSTRLEEILQAAQMEKGGLYRHFGSKAELATEAFAYALDLWRQRYAQATARSNRPKAQLIEMLKESLSFIERPPLPGGSPMMVQASDLSDEATSPLRQRTQEALHQWHRMIENIVLRAIDTGDMHPKTDPETVATVIISTLEGALYLSHLHDDYNYLQRGVQHLLDYVERC